MVDWNSGDMLRTPINELYKILILQRRHDFMEALERWNSAAEQRGQANDSIVKSRVWTLYLEIQPLLKSNTDEKDKAIDELKRIIEEAHTLETYRTVCEYVNDFLFKQRIITTIPLTVGKIDRFKTIKNAQTGIREVFEEATDDG